MKTRVSRLLGTVGGIAVLAALASGCGDSSNDTDGDVASTPPPAAVDDKTVIPASAGASGTAFASYVKTLPADESGDEPRTFAPEFSDPPEDGDEPVPAS